MPALPPSFARAAACVAALLSLSVAATERPVAAPAEPTQPAKPAKPARAEPLRDPLDVLRERLAQKLGASRSPDPANPNVVRVVSKASTASAPADAHEPAAPPPKRAAARRAPVAAPAHDPAGWDYAGRSGPERWGRLKPEFAKCASGRRQSPIDIRDGLRVELDPVRFDYQPGGFRVVDTGRTVQVNPASGNAIEVMGRRYELVQFHFHRPSEERIDGKQAEMGVHLVHKDQEGRVAIVALQLDRGAAQPLVQSVWNNLPLEKGDEVAARTTVNLNDLLPAERDYVTYMGSLTTPPCSEGVLWMVMKQPVPVSAEQIGLFARLYPMNARPVQSASGRRIKESR